MNIAEEDVKKAVQDANASQLKTFEKGCWIEALEWVIENIPLDMKGTREIQLKIDEIRGDAPDPDPETCREHDCPLYINGSSHTAGMLDCTKIS